MRETSLLQGPRGLLLAMAFKWESVAQAAAAAAAAEVAAAAAAAAATAQCKRHVVLIDETHWASNIQMQKESFKRVGKRYIRIVKVTR